MDRKEYIEALAEIGFKEIEGRPLWFTHPHIAYEEFDLSHGSYNVFIAISTVFYYGRIAGNKAARKRISEAMGLGGEK